MLGTLGITGEAVKAESSNPDLFEVKNGVLTAKEAFSSEETLTVYMADGSVFVIQVTDACAKVVVTNVAGKYHLYFVYDNYYFGKGSTYLSEWVEEAFKIPAEIKSPDDVPWKDYRNASYVRIQSSFSNCRPFTNAGI